MASATSFYDFKPKDSLLYPCISSLPRRITNILSTLAEKGQPYDLTTLKNKVVLVVNTASKCGFTPQYASLETLYKKISATHKDFVILGFPCNQFMGQDPGSDDEIQNFCLVNYGVSFPVLGKTEVNGEKAEPVFEWLKKEAPGLFGLKRVKWNFEKFVVARDGSVVGRWASTTKPESLESVILEELKKGKGGGAKAEL
ncbi:MAG: hypothetical protein Q9169_004510 [Polycauliona sp. 2 TL-2023]